MYEKDIDDGNDNTHDYDGNVYDDVMMSGVLVKSFLITYLASHKLTNPLGKGDSHYKKRNHCRIDESAMAGKKACIRCQKPFRLRRRIYAHWNPG